MRILSVKFCFAKLGNNFQRSHPWLENAFRSQTLILRAPFQSGFAVPRLP
jgi:hypothetical protein